MIAIGILLLLLAVFLFYCAHLLNHSENYPLLSGWGALDPEDQERFGPLMAKDARLFLRVYVIILLLMAACAGQGVFTPSVAGEFAMAYLVIFTLLLTGILLLIRRPYRRGTGRIAMIGLGVVMLLMAAGTTILLHWSLSSPAVTVDNDQITIQSVYGVEGQLSHVDHVGLVHESMSIRRRVNGFRLGGVYKGVFTVADKKRVRLYLMTEQPPYIHISSREFGEIYINASTIDATEALYTRINDHWQSRHSRGSVPSDQ